jgi:hypothetical protein
LESIYTALKRRSSTQLLSRFGFGEPAAAQFSSGMLPGKAVTVWLCLRWNDDRYMNGSL